MVGSIALSGFLLPRVRVGGQDKAGRRERE
jgi:hypothetical protein